jgi:uncharacterized RDD family membrane protein YckC
MTTEERLSFCKICIHQKFSMNSGILCRLTNQVADFEGECPSFAKDADLVNRLNKSSSADEDIVGSGKRFANYIIDLIAISVFYGVFLFFLAIIVATVSPSSVNALGENSLLNYVIAFGTMFIYYGLSESLTGRTLGKLATGTRVVNNKGITPSVNEILLRTLCRFVPFDALSFFGDSGWHDDWSKTKVVSINKQI